MPGCMGGVDSLLTLRCLHHFEQPETRLVLGANEKGSLAQVPPGGAGPGVVQGRQAPR